MGGALEGSTSSISGAIRQVPACTERQSGGAVEGGGGWVGVSVFPRRLVDTSERIKDPSSAFILHSHKPCSDTTGRLF